MVQQAVLMKNMEENAGRLMEVITAQLAAREAESDSKKPLTVIVFRSEQYKAQLSLNKDREWTMESPAGKYKMKDPSLEDLLEKYARLTDPEFNANVGDLALYENYENYRKASRRYIEKKRLAFLQIFVNSLEESSNSV